MLKALLTSGRFRSWKSSKGNGVARELTVYALARLKALGAKDVFLATAETNNTARHLYESLGFTHFRKQIHYALRINSPPKEDP